MALTVDLSPRAFRDLSSLPKDAAERILEGFEILKQTPWPGPPKVKKLKGAGLFRLRVGDYRCIFERWGREKVVVHRIIDRKDLEKALRGF